jgi:hypothetical protein
MGDEAKEETLAHMIASMVRTAEIAAISDPLEVVGHHMGCVPSVEDADFDGAHFLKHISGAVISVFWCKYGDQPGRWMGRTWGATPIEAAEQGYCYLGPARYGGKIPLGNRPHASDCAVHSGPAYPPGPCNCGAVGPVHNRFGRSLALVISLSEQIMQLRQARDDAQRMLLTAIELKNRYFDQLAAKDARIAELDSELSKRPMALVNSEPEPLKHDPFRDFGGDPRRMGR